MKKQLLFLCLALFAIAAKAQTITGPSFICIGTPTTYSGTPSGGTWSVSTTAVATVGVSSGVATGWTPGTVTITYTLPSSAFATITVTVNPGASISTAGSFFACVGGSISHSGTPTGGTWSATPSSVASVSSSGIVSGLSGGVAFVTYTAPSGCRASVLDTFYATPSAIGGSLTTCVGTNTTLTNSVAGGTWTSSSPSVGTINSFTGVATGITPGTTVIMYYSGPGCMTSAVLTVNPAVTASLGASSICVGATTTIAGSPSGGFWSSSAPSVALPGMSGITGVSAGSAIITYSVGGCSVTMPITVLPVPSVISGIGTVCLGGSGTATASPAGGIWSSSVPGVVMISASTGAYTTAMPGTSIISYTISTGCSSSFVATVIPIPVITATATPDACGNGYSITASGGTTYAWTGPASLSCTLCGTTSLSPSGPTTITVNDVSSTGCGASATVTISGNRIYGHISFSALPPASPAMQVYLVQFNPSDSSIIGVDSVATCVDGGSPFYKFDGKPAGNYLVKARLNSAIPGTSDYIPTYGASTANWFSATNISHASGTDVQDINMLYGTVPSGPGFISGYVYSGAGKGTAGEIPVAGMIVYLKNTSGTVLTYTYTNTYGAYSFGSLAYGDYVVYPAEHSYYTTPSSTISLTAAAPSAASVGFRRYNTSGVILPWALPVSTFTASYAASGITVYPNPASTSLNVRTSAQQEGTLTISLTDVTGRVVLSTVATVDVHGNATTDISTVSAGLYMVRITSGSMNYTGKLSVQH